MPSAAHPKPPVSMHREPPPQSWPILFFYYFFIHSTCILGDGAATGGCFGKLNLSSIFHPSCNTHWWTARSCGAKRRPFAPCSHRECCVVRRTRGGQPSDKRHTTDAAQRNDTLPCFPAKPSPSRRNSFTHLDATVHTLHLTPGQRLEDATYVESGSPDGTPVNDH
jgi:hypothetical protein